MSVGPASVVRTMELGMQDHSGGQSAGVGVLRTEDVQALTARMSSVDRGLSNTERIDQVRVLEELACAARAAQAVLAVDFDASMRVKAAEAGVLAERQGRGIAAQVAFARRESLHRGERALQLAKVVTREMPCTMAAWAQGRVDEYTVTLLVKETACLSREDRGAVDAEVAGDPVALESDERAAGRGRSVRGGVPADPMSFVERRRRAEADRHTSLRAAPDVMSWFTALLRSSRVWRCTRHCRPRPTANGLPGTRGVAGRSWPTRSWSG